MKTRAYSALAVATTAATAVYFSKYKLSALPASPISKDESDKDDHNSSARREMVLTSHEARELNVLPHSCNIAKNQARDLCIRLKDEVGAPGLTVGVSVDGQMVWQEGLGYSDVENRVKIHPHSVMRIASVSKSMTMAAVGKLWEDGKLDLDKPVQEYVPSFPIKAYEGKEVQITTRMLLCHMSGIRHYEKKAEEKRKSMPGNDSDKENVTKRKKIKSDDNYAEFLIKDKFPSVEKSLELFKNDELVSAPGTNFLYTTHGWTLVGAVVEGITKVPFDKYMQNLFRSLGLNKTYLDENEPLIYNRSRYYVKNERGRLINAPYVDNSYKWAGGGFLSTVGDLVKFGNAMLYSHQCCRPEKSTPAAEMKGFLKPETMVMMWTPVANTKMAWDKQGSYGLGWGVVPFKEDCKFCRKQEFYVSHTGGAVGGSSVLLVLPTECQGNPPKGVVVAMITNLQGVNLNTAALDIARLFSSDNNNDT